MKKVTDLIVTVLVAPMALTFVCGGFVGFCMGAASTEAVMGFFSKTKNNANEDSANEEETEDTEDTEETEE